MSPFEPVLIFDYRFVILGSEATPESLFGFWTRLLRSLARMTFTFNYLLKKGVTFLLLFDIHLSTAFSFDKKKNNMERAIFQAQAPHKAAAIAAKTNLGIATDVRSQLQNK